MLKVILIVIKVAIVVLLMYMIKEHASNMIYNKDSDHDVIDCLACVVYFIGICIYVGEIILLVCHVGG